MIWSFERLAAVVSVCSFFIKFIYFSVSFYLYCYLFLLRTFCRCVFLIIWSVEGLITAVSVIIILFFDLKKLQVLPLLVALSSFDRCIKLSFTNIFYGTRIEGQGNNLFRYVHNCKTRGLLAGINKEITNLFHVPCHVCWMESCCTMFSRNV